MTRDRDQPTGRRPRRSATVVLAALTAVSLTLSTVAVWVRSTALDTERFMAVVGPVIADDDVAAAVAEQLTTDVLELLSVEERIEAVLLDAQSAVAGSVADALDLGPVERRVLGALGPDEGLERLAAPLAAGIEQRVADAVDRVVTSAELRALLADGVEAAHRRAVLLVRGELDQLPLVTVDRGVVHLDLRPLVGRVLLELRSEVLDLLRVDPGPGADSGDPAAVVDRIAAALDVELPSTFARIPVTAESELVAVQDAVRALDRAVWAIVAATAALGVATVVVSRDRRRAAIALALGALVAGGLSVLATRWLVARLADLGSTPATSLAIVRVADATVGPLRSSLLVVLVVAGVTVLALRLTERRAGTTTPRSSRQE